MSFQRHLKILIIGICTIFLVGCGDKVQNRNPNTTNAVDKVLQEQMDNKETEQISIEDDTEEKEIEDIQSEEIKREEIAKSNSDVEIDLTGMGSDMVYATVYQLMVNPKDYEGMTIKMEGRFYATFYEPTNKYYYYCVIQDAMACCAQGIEFVWDDGIHKYPDEYPADNSTILVSGTFETYTEDGDENLYCRLKDAKMIAE